MTTKSGSQLETEEKIKIMQAFVDGETIEFIVNEDIKLFDQAQNWQIMENPSWNWAQYSYRIASDLISYRRWLTTRNYVYTHNKRNTIFSPENDPEFDCWIDHEWQTI